MDNEIRIDSKEIENAVEAILFAAGHPMSYSKLAEVIGIGEGQLKKKVKKFAEKYSLPFVLLSDPDLVAIKAYGVWQEKKLYGKLSFGVVRTTFIIDEAGNIEKVMKKVKPDTNAAEILAEL